MFLFFFNLGTAIFTGTWINNSYDTMLLQMNRNFKSIGKSLLYALSQNEGALTIINQDWDYINFPSLFALIFATILFFYVVFGTWKIIKGILSIFFEGWR